MAAEESGIVILFNKDISLRGRADCTVFGGRSFMGANLQMGYQAIPKPTRWQCGELSQEGQAVLHSNRSALGLMNSSRHRGRLSASGWLLKIKWGCEFCHPIITQFLSLLDYMY